MAAEIELDSTDHQILELLRTNARRTIADIAQRVAISPTAVKRRIGRLEEQEVITGYAAQIDYPKLGWAHEAFIEIRFTGTTDPKDMDRTAARLPEAQAVFTTAGDHDVLVWVRATDVNHLTRVIADLRAAPNIIGTRSHMVLRAHLKPHWHPPLVD
jgi:DNA-binding Lrp family transcriptional regulator